MKPDWFQTLGHKGIGIFERLGRAGILLVSILGGLPALLTRLGLVVYQIYCVGVLSLVIIVVSGLFVGMVLGFQMHNILINFGTEESLGVVVALMLVRELGPVITALLFAGRAGSAVTAEIGLMKATGQLSALEMMAVDPIRRVLAPRFLAGIIAMPLLAAIFSVVGIYGAHFIGVDLLGLDDGVFWSRMQDTVDLRDDIYNGIIKSLVFGAVVTWIAVFEGYDTVPTSEGVGRATTRSVVYSSLAVLGLDFVLTAVMFGEI